MSAIVGSLKVLLGLDATDYISGLTKADTLATQFTEKQKRKMAAIDRVVTSLQKEADMLGRSARQQKLMELAAKGATEAQLRSADAALRSVEAHQAYAKVGALVGTAAVAAVTGVVLLTKHAIDAADNLNDLSKKTGIAVETLGGIGFAAEQAGSNVEDVAQAVGKLNLKIAEARAGKKEAVDLFKTLGLDDLVKRGASVEEFLVALAGKFESYEDSPQKAALANATFSKAYQAILPLLDDGAEGLLKNINYFKQYSGVTQDLAEKADQFNDTLEKLQLLSAAYGATLATKTLPTLQAIADAMVQGKEQSGLLGDATSLVSYAFRKGAETAAFLSMQYDTLRVRALGLVQQLKAIATLDFKAGDRIAEDVAKGVERAQAEYADFLRTARGEEPSPDAGEGGVNLFAGQKPAKGPAPDLPDPNAKAEALADLKAKFDQQIKAIDDFAQRRRDAYEFANRYLDAVYAEGLVSLQASFDAEKAIRAAQLSSEVQSYTERIAKLRAEEAEAKGLGAKKAELRDIESKIADAIDKRSAAEQKASQDAILAAQQQVSKLREVRRAYDDIRATILELSGDTRAAAEIRIQQQLEEARKTITQASGDQSLLPVLEQRLRGAEELKQAQTEYQRLLDRQQDSEEALQLAAQASGESEVETLQKLGRSRAEALVQMSAMVDKANELALQLGTPDAVRWAEQLGLAFKKAAAQADPLLQKERELAGQISGSFEDAIVEGLEPGAKVQDVVKRLGHAIIETLNRELLARPAAEWLKNYLGGTGQQGGLLSGIFGGSSGTGTDTSKDTAAALEQFQKSITQSSTQSDTFASSMVQVVTGNTTATISMSDLAVSADAAAAALQAVAASQGASGGFDFLSLFGLGGAGGTNGSAGDASTAGTAALGGTVQPGSMTEVAENRPEMLDVGGKKFLLMGNQRGTIDPNPRGMSRPSQTLYAPITVNMPAGTTQQTANQVGSTIAMRLRRATLRNS